ncbi:histone-lysine N-methyltransferase, H3 lysine-79 specific [Hydra vulgaris]|uniref:Histone-lysine N-methyltransferase, H3 lysine-79 specific n=1 Tax=Hydra vulgaris TaxID=6087 RepID=A0ABM4DDN9_HYDVU
MENLNNFPNDRHLFTEHPNVSNTFNPLQIPFNQLHGTNRLHFDQPPGINQIPFSLPNGNNQRFSNQPIDFPLYSSPNYNNMPNFPFQQAHFPMVPEHSPNYPGIKPFFRSDPRVGYIQMNSFPRAQKPSFRAQHFQNNSLPKTNTNNQQQHFKVFGSEEGNQRNVHSSPEQWHTIQPLQFSTDLKQSNSCVPNIFVNQVDIFPLPIPTHLDPMPIPSSFMSVPGNKQNLNFQNLPPNNSFTLHKSIVSKDNQNDFKENIVSMVESWLKTRQNGTKKEQKKILKIFEYKDLLKEYITLMNTIRDHSNSLAENITMNESQWQVHVAEGKIYKEKLLQMKDQLFDEAQIKFISEKLKARKKKRERARRRKKQESEEYLANISKRMKLHEQIDDAIHKKQMEILRQKMVDNLKNEAGESLVEVKRKQYETDERIAVFQLLKDLRDLRKETSIYKGILPTENENISFDGTVSKAIELLKKQRKIYEDEEKALRVLREEETEEFNRLENEKQKKRKQNRRMDLYTFDPMIPFRMYWLQAEESLAALIHIRSLWDFYLAPSDSLKSSRIPEGFINAAPPSSSEWRKYLIKTKSIKSTYK